MAVNAVIGTFSPYPGDVLKILKGELQTPKPQPKIDPMIQLNQHVQSGEHTTGVTTDRKGKLKVGNQPMNATKTIFDLVTSREEREAADAFFLAQVGHKKKGKPAANDLGMYRSLISGCCSKQVGCRMGSKESVQNCNKVNRGPETVHGVGI